MLLTLPVLQAITLQYLVRLTFRRIRSVFFVSNSRLVDRIAQFV